MSYFNIIAQSSESTVVTEYKPQAKRSEAYQSEADLEQEFIRLLCELGYERLTIHKEADLIANLRTQLEKLNNYRFTDGEWKRFWDEVLANNNSGILEKTMCRCSAGITGKAKISSLLTRSASIITVCRSSTSMPSPQRRGLLTIIAMM